MDEEKSQIASNKTEEAQRTNDHTNGGGVPAATEIIKQTNAAVERMAKENDRAEQIEAKRAENNALIKLGGGTEAGNGNPVVMSEDQKMKQGAMEFWKGTGIEKSIEKHG